jgi:hypothetical protein
MCVDTLHKGDDDDDDDNFAAETEFFLIEVAFTSQPSLICSQSAVSWSRLKNMWSLTSTLSLCLHAVVEILHDLGIGVA